MYVHEFYLDIINIRKYRHALAQFRSGVHQLEIERGRYHNIPYDQRLCKLCNLEIEDEMHFMFRCETYAQLRQLYIPSQFYTNPSRIKLSILFTSRNEQYVWNTALFIYHALNLKKSLLN